jgi:hypothetical protein
VYDNEMRYTHWYLKFGTDIRVHVAGEHRVHGPQPARYPLEGSPLTHRPGLEAIGLGVLPAPGRELRYTFEGHPLTLGDMRQVHIQAAVIFKTSNAYLWPCLKQFDAHSILL